MAAARILAMVAKTGMASRTSLELNVRTSDQTDTNSAGVLRRVEAKSTWNTIVESFEQGLSLMLKVVG